MLLCELCVQIVLCPFVCQSVFGDERDSVQKGTELLLYLSHWCHYRLTKRKKKNRGVVVFCGVPETRYTITSVSLLTSGVKTVHKLFPSLLRHIRVLVAMRMKTGACCLL